MKAVEDMTPEEIAAERAAIAAERERLTVVRAQRDATLREVSEELNEKAATLSQDEIAIANAKLLGVVDGAAEADDEAEETPWPHQQGWLKGHLIEVRRPAPAALVAISMTGSSELTSATQMKVFSTFMVKHISPKSLDLVLGLMADPDSGIEMQDVISALTEDVVIPE